jgi:hypothetical protein
MNKKILAITLLALVMLTTPLIVAVQAGYGGKNKATFEWEVQLWALRPPHEDTRGKVIEKEEGDMIVSKNIHTVGEPPLVDDINIPPLGTTPPWNPTWDDYPDGGIRLNITKGTNTYTLVGSFEKVMQWIVMVPRGAMLENSRWSFEITDVESGVAPDDAVGSTMYGTLINIQGGSEMAIKSTKGTGIFEGAFLRGTHLTSPGIVFHPTIPGVYTVFSYSTGSGEIVFP